MPTRLLLEGPDIQALLAQVRQEHGTGAKIVSADRVRPNGLAGLFGKPKFELTVEVDDAPAGSGPRAASDVASDAAPAAPEPDGFEPFRPAPGFKPAVPLRSAAPRPAGDSPADSLLAMLEARENGRENGHQTDHQPDAGGQAPTQVPDRPRVPNANPTPASFAEVLAGLGLGQPAPHQPVNRPTPTEPPVPTDQHTAAHPERFTGVSGLRARLAALGLPPKLLAQVTDPDSYPAIVRILGALPAAPAMPTRADELLVIVGELTAALAVAQHVSRELTLGPACTLVAAASTTGTGVHPSRRVTGPGQAARRIAKLRGIAGPLILVVDAPVDSSANEWARTVVESVDATAVWAVVDATRKAADSARYVSGLGRVDALAVRGVAATADPATVLAIDVPVALLDEQPANPHAWAGLLCRRLADEHGGAIA